MTGWLKQHLEEFVEPRLAKFKEEYDKELIDYAFKSTSKPYFTSEEMTLIKNAWRSVKRQAQGRTILLAGRDVFVFEVLARREGIPTRFMPECSRASVRSIKLSEEEKETFHLFDTGFMGSIPKALEIGHFSLLSFHENNYLTKFNPRESLTNAIQVFPRLSGSRGLALKIERTPKYWRTAHVVDGQIVQEYSEWAEFIRAAQLTMEVYKDSSPKQFNRPTRSLWTL